MKTSLGVSGFTNFPERRQHTSAYVSIRQHTSAEVFTNFPERGADCRLLRTSSHDCHTHTHTYTHIHTHIIHTRMRYAMRMYEVLVTCVSGMRLLRTSSHACESSCMSVYYIYTTCLYVSVCVCVQEGEMGVRAGGGYFTHHLRVYARFQGL